MSDYARTIRNGDIVTLVEWLIHAAVMNERARGYTGPPNPATGKVSQEVTAAQLARAKANLLDTILDRTGVTGHLNDNECAA